MPRNPKGEMTVSEIRNLAKEINDKLKIKNIAQTSRAMLIKQIEARGYKLDHPNKRLVRGRGKVPRAPREKTITVKKPIICNGLKEVVVYRSDEEDDITDTELNRKLNENIILREKLERMALDKGIPIETQPEPEPELKP